MWGSKSGATTQGLLDQVLAIILTRTLGVDVPGGVSGINIDLPKGVSGMGVDSEERCDCTRMVGSITC